VSADSPTWVWSFARVLLFIKMFHMPFHHACLCVYFYECRHVPRVGVCVCVGWGVDSWHWATVSLWDWVKGGGEGGDEERDGPWRKRNDLDNSLSLWHAHTDTHSAAITHTLLLESWPQENPGKHPEIDSDISLLPQGRIHELKLSIKGNPFLLPHGHKHAQEHVHSIAASCD